MPFDVHETLMVCAACQKQKPFDNRVSYKFIKPNYAWHTVSVDVVGPFDSSSLRNKYLIVAINHLTKWVEIWAIKDLTAATTAKFIFEQVICRHGCPQVILTDNGTNFAGSVLPKLNSLMCIRSALTTPYHPEANGMVKRVNSTLVDILRKLTTEFPRAWCSFIEFVSFAYNTSFHSSTLQTPFRMLYGRNPSVPPILYALMPKADSTTPSNYLFLLVKTLINIQSKAFNSAYSSRKAAHEKDQETRRPLLAFKEKDKVLYHNTLDHPRRNKLATIWDGPFEIISVLLADAYTIKNLSTGIIVKSVHGKSSR